MLCRMKIGYGYRKRADDLAACGAERIIVDDQPDRPGRGQLVQLVLRPGDTLVLLHLRDLGGSPVADRQWTQRIEGLGVTMQICTPPATPAVKGRPRQFDPQAEINSRVRSIWLDGTKSELVRLAEVRELVDAEVSRSTLQGRYGWPSKPKPERGREKGPSEPDASGRSDASKEGVRQNC